MPDWGCHLLLIQVSGVLEHAVSHRDVIQKATSVASVEVRPVTKAREEVEVI